jgi:hypothetical protein
MGSGEVVGNQSVHWKMDHDKPVGQQVPVRANESRRPRNGDPFEVSHDRVVTGRDPKPNVREFSVRLRFESKADANAQLQAALNDVTQAPTGQSFFLTFRVPATVNGRPRDNPEVDPKPDIGIDW